MDSNEEVNAPFFPRLMAFVVDCWAAVALAFCTIALVSFARPLDEKRTFTVALVAGLLVAIGYLGATAPLLGRTLGKALFGLRVVSVAGEAPISGGRWLVRAVLGPLLWPLSGIVLLVTKSRQHLGDLAAKTRVVIGLTKESMVLTMLVAVALLGGFVYASFFAMKTVAGNTSAWKAARASLPGDDVELASLVVTNDVATAYAKRGAQGYRLAMGRQAGVWRVLETKRVGPDSMASTYRVDFGSGAVPDYRTAILSKIAELVVQATGTTEVRLECPDDLGETFTCSADGSDLKGMKVLAEVQATRIHINLPNVAVGPAFAVTVAGLFETNFGMKATDWQCPPRRIMAPEHPIACTAKLPDGPFTMKSVLAEDGTFQSMQSDELVTTETLVGFAQKDWAAQESKPVEIRCAQSVYVQKAGQPIRCGVTSPADVTLKLEVVFTPDGKGQVDVQFAPVGR